MSRQGFFMSTVRGEAAPNLPIFQEVGAIVNLSGFAGWVYANSKIYGVPYNSNQIGMFDPATNVFSLVGTAFAALADKYVGGVLAANGFIYFTPFRSARVVKFNPADNSYTLIGTTFSTGLFKWTHGVLAPNGCIYCAPWANGQTLKIDPSTDTTTLVGTNFGGATNKFGTGNLAPNGKIYFYPRSRTQIMKLDPDTDTTTEVGAILTGTGASKFIGGVVQTDGKIAVLPFLYREAGNLVGLYIDPATDTWTTWFYSSNAGANNITQSGVPLPEGTVYWNSTFSEYYKLSTTTLSHGISEPLLNSSHNVGAVAASNGAIYLFHSDANRKIIKITNIGIIPASAYTFPALVDLKDSEYNRYQNKY